MLQIRNTILGLTFLLTYNVWSQTDKNGKIEAQEIIIIKDYKVNLEEAVKMNFSPKTPPSENFKKNKLSYNIPSKLKQLSFEPKPVQTLSFTKSVADKFTESYIKLGFGTQISPLIDILHNQKFSKDLNFKLGINHLSANRTDINMPWQRYFTNHLFTGLDYYGKKIIIKPRASFLYNHNNFYAPDLPVSPEGVSEIGRNYQIFSFQNNIITYTGKKGITFQNEIRGDLMKDNINNTTLDTAKKKYNEYRYGGDISIEKNFKNTHII